MELNLDKQHKPGSEAVRENLLKSENVSSVVFGTYRPIPAPTPLS